MRAVPPSRWPFALFAYLAAAFLIGLAIEPGQAALAAMGFSQKLSMPLAVNLLLPASIIAISLWYPRLSTTLAAAPLALLGFTLARCLLHDLYFWHWTSAWFLQVMSPIVLVGVVVSSAISAVLVAAIRARRYVGLPDAAQRCAACGYLLTGTTSGRCSECGAAF